MVFPIVHPFPHFPPSGLFGGLLVVLHNPYGVTARSGPPLLSWWSFCLIFWFILIREKLMLCPGVDYSLCTFCPSLPFLLPLSAPSSGARSAPWSSTPLRALNGSLAAPTKTGLGTWWRACSPASPASCSSTRWAP